MNNGFREILFIAADSGDGQFRFIVDPELRRELEKEGIRCHSCFISQLRREHLSVVDAVVLMRTPMPGHAKNDYAMFKEKTPWLYEFVAGGGGLLLMFAESYGRTEKSLNEFAEEFNIAFRFNYLEEKDSSRAGMVPNLDNGRTINAGVFPVIPGLDGIDELELIVDGGHGVQHLTCECGAEWRHIVRGSESCVSRPFPEGLYAGSGNDDIYAPVFGACRTYGKGRIAAFPGSSPLWIASAFLPRWNGFLMRQQHNGGLRFIIALLHWLSAISIRESCAVAVNWPEAAGQREFSFRYADDAERRRLLDYQPYRVWIGTLPAGQTVTALASEAKESGCAVVVIVHDYDSLTLEQWREYRTEYAQIEDVIVVPAYEQRDDEGNYSVVFNVDELPDQRRSYPNSNLLEDLLVKLNGYSAVYARPSANRLPYWRHGGYNLMEADCEDAVEMFREKVASAGFIGAVHVSRGVGPAAEVWRTWVCASDATAWKEALTENLHLSFVSSGPRLRHFGFYGPRLVVDDWEGLWYEWDDCEQGELLIAVDADAELTEVVVWDGNEPLAHFSPNCKTFRKILEIKFEHDLHLHLTARDAAGGELVCSWPVHTRNRVFWAHAGSDQMNDYHNVFEPDADGFLGIGDRYYEPYGFVTCGYAWGDYVRITPSTPWSDIMPSGIEVSSMAGNFKSFHPSPFIALPDGFDFLNHHFRRLGRCTGREHVVCSDADSSWLENTGATWIADDGKIFYPTRTITESPLWRCSARYVIPRWSKYGWCRVRIEMNIVWCMDHEFAPGQGMSIGHSLHQYSEGLVLNDTALDTLLHPGRTADDGAIKEWDNLGVIPLLRMPYPSQMLIPCECAGALLLTGDPAEVFAFKPLEVPGIVAVRGWYWKNNGFVLSFEMIPEQKSFRAGDVLRIVFEFAAAPDMNPHGRETL